MNEIYASGGKVQEGFWDAIQMPNSVRSAYGSDLKKLATHMNGVADAGGTATATLKDMNNVLLEQGRAVVDDTTLTQKFVGGIKSIGMTLGSMAFSSIANLGISWVLQQAIGGISDWVHRDDIAIENGQKSQQSISDTFNEFSKGKTTLNTLGQSFASANQQITSTGDAIQSVATKYTELSKGVDKNTNANIGLSDEDYQTYLDISSQLATLYPQLQSGTDAQGNAMLNLGTNAQNAAKSIQELYSSSMLSTNVKIGDELQQAFKGVSTQVDKYQKQVDEYDKKAAEFRDKQTDASDFKLDATKLNKFVKDRGITLDTKELGDEYSNYVNRITDILKDNNIAYDINDNGGAFIDKDGNTRTISNLWITDPNVTEEQLQSVGKKISSFSNNLADKFSAKATEMESKSASTTALIKDQWKGMTDSLGQYLQTTDSFDKLDSNLKTNLLKNLKNLDIESLSKEYDGDALQFMYDKFMMPLSNLSKDQQQAISDVLNIDKTKSTASEYANQVNSAFEKIFPNDKKLQDQWKKNFGLQDIIDDNSNQIKTLSNKFKDAKSKITKSDLETLTNGDRDIAYNLVVDDGEAFRTFDELQKRIAATKQTISEKDLSLDSMKQVVTDATSAYSSLSTAISESTSDTGMTADSINNIKSSIESLINDNDELKDFDLNSLFTDTAKGVKLNNDKLKDMLELQHDLRSKDFADSVKNQTDEIKKQDSALKDITKGTDEYTAAQEKLNTARNELAETKQARSQYNALYHQQQESLSDYADWVNAQSTKNAGDKYTNMVTGLKNAEELFNKGLVGTDDFKTFAKMISPTGATDAADFKENYGKATRYLTEDDKGVKNFLNDLKTKGLATYSDSDGWNIGDIDLKRDSRAMGIGKDFMSNMFGRLEDYGFHNNVFSTTEEGVQKLSEAYKNLFDSQSRVKDLEKNDSGNATAIQGAKDDVEAYKADIEQIKNGFSNVTEDTADQYSAEIDAAHDQAEFLEKQREEVLLDKDGKYGDKAKQIASMMEADIDELKSKYEDSLDDIDVKTEKQIKKEAKDKENANKDATPDNPSTPDFGNDEQSKKTYDDVFKQIKDAKDNNDKDVQQAIDTLSNFTADQVNGVDLFDSKYDSDELKPAEQALDSLKEKFQLTDEQAQMLGKVFESMGVLKPETDTSDVDKVKDDAKEAVDDLNEITGKQYKIDFDTTDPDKIQQQLNEISSEVDKHVTTDSEGNPHYDESQEGAVEAEKAYKAEVQHQQQNEYETSAMGQYESDNSLVQAMQNFMQAKNEMDTQTQYAQKGMDNTLQTATDDANKAYENLKQAAQESGNSSIDLSDIQTAEDSILALSNKDIKEKVDVDTSQAESNIQNLQNLEGSSITINADISTNGGVEELENSLASIPQGVSTTVTCDVEGESDVDNLESSMESIPDDTPVTIDCHVENQEQLDQIQKKADALNANGKQIKINATVGEVKTDGVASNTPVDVKGNVTEVTGTPSGTVDVKGNVTKVTGNPSGTVNVKGKLTGKLDGSSTKNASVSFKAKHNLVDSYKPEDKHANVEFKPTHNLVDSYEPEDKHANVNYGLGSTPNYNPPDIQRTVTYTIQTIGSVPSGGSTTHSASSGKSGGSNGIFASGTMTSLSHARAFASGSLTDFSPAFAKGKVSIPHDQTALVNEEYINGHSESIVHNGVWSLIPGGAHLANLKKGDMIFSASQTEALLKNGNIPGHARAYASGTVGDIDLSSAFAGGMHGKFQGGAAGVKLNSSDSSKSSGGGNSDSGTTKANTEAVKDNTSKVKHSTETFDWVARALKKFKNATEEIADSITDYVSSAFKKSQLQKQIRALEQETDANSKGYQTYLDKAESIAKKYTYWYTPDGSDSETSMDISIPDVYKQEVQNGTWNIEDMDTSTDANKALAEAIQKYQDYYDKATDCRKAVQDLENEQLKVFDQWASMPTEVATKKIDKLTNSFNALKNALSTISSGGSGLKAMASQIIADTPGLSSATASVNRAKKAQRKSSAKLTSAKTKYSKSKTKETKANRAASNASSDLLDYLSVSRLPSNVKKKIRQSVNSGKIINPRGIKNSKVIIASLKYNGAITGRNTAQSNTKKAQNAVTEARKALQSSNKNVQRKESKANSIVNKLPSALRAVYKYRNDVTYRGQNAILDLEYYNQKKQNKVNQKALRQTKVNTHNYRKSYNNQVKSVRATGSSIINQYSGLLNKSQKKALVSGQMVDTTGISDSNLLNVLATYNASVKRKRQTYKKLTIAKDKQSSAQATANQSQADVAAMKISKEQSKFSNIQNYYGAKETYQKSITENRQKKYDLSEAHGNYTSTKSYDSQISNLRAERKIKAQESKTLESQLKKSVKNGSIKKGSQEWLEMRSKIAEAKNAVADFNTEIEQAKQDKIALYYEQMFDRAIEKATQLKDKVSTINDLITEEMKINKTTGKLTDMGALSIIMDSDAINVGKKNIQTLLKKKQKLEDDFKKGNIGRKSYDEQMTQINSDIQSNIRDISSSRQAIISLITSQAQAVKDALFKEIDAYKKAYKKKKEYYDYDKTIGKKTDEIELIKQQIRGLEGLTDAESKAQKARLEASLKDKQDDLDDTVRNHVYDLTVNGLDDLEDQLNEDFEKWSNKLSSDLSNMSKAISNAIKSSSNSSELKKALSDILKQFGLNPNNYFSSSENPLPNNKSSSSGKTSSTSTLSVNSSNTKVTGVLQNSVGKTTSNIATTSSTKPASKTTSSSGKTSSTSKKNSTPKLNSNLVTLKNEDGKNISTTKYKSISSLQGSSTVPRNLSRELSISADKYQDSCVNNISKLSSTKPVTTSNNGNVNITYGSLITVKGDVTKDALPDLQTIVKKASAYTQNEIRKNKKRFS